MKNLKLNIKNTQLAEALNINKIKKKKKVASKDDTSSKSDKQKTAKKPRARIIPKKEEEKQEKPEKAASEQAVEEIDIPDEVPTVVEEKTPQQEEKVEQEAVEQEVVEAVKEKPEKKPPPTKKETLAKEKEKETEKPKTPQKNKKKTTPQEPGQKSSGFKDFKEFKAARRKEHTRSFDARDKQGLRDLDDERWRKKKSKKALKRTPAEEEVILRPKSLRVRLPITIKDLSQEMKRKSSELVSKLFMQGITLTLNDFLDDETTIQLLGHEFGCEIIIDTSEEERIRITDKSIQEEIQQTPKEKQELRPPVITFMGHVDHGKTSLIDTIRETNVTAQEAGAITQHIGAFKTVTSTGTITILDTPGHEAFTEMRERGATVTDIVVLVIAGDEGMRDQTIEAMNQAKEADVPIVVAINKSDKQNFDPQKVYRELADHELLPESWGGNTITVNCSAVTKEGITELLELIALQAEILELRAAPDSRARGTVLESQMHKGLGAVATVLVQNGTLKMGDAIVLGHYYGRIKTMHDEYGKVVQEAGPSSPVKITGLSGLAEAGNEFIVVHDEKEAKDLADLREEGFKRKTHQLPKKSSLENLMQSKEKNAQKVLPLILRADVQGSLEALKTSLKKIHSKKVRLEFVSEDIGEISESDIELASASKATIIGFHTQIESHAEALIKKTKIIVRMHDVIYHAVDDVKHLMAELLDKVEEEKDTGKAEVKAVFKSSQLGLIAGCIVLEGAMSRNDMIRVMRNGEKIWKGKIASLKRVKEDVKEVQKGLECGILLEGFSDLQVGDTLEGYEIIYHKQKLE